MLAITSVRDIVADRYLGFQLCRNVKEACRGFVDAMGSLRSDRNDLLVNHPGDFELWLLGWFDEDSGYIGFNDPEDGFNCPRRILSGSLANQMIQQNVEVRDFFDTGDFYDESDFKSALESEE